jgi:two-component system, OmpR family, alkaline phosphatase synthesis response regulator PhoP
MSKKILFVEDDEGFFNLFSAALSMRGYNIIHVADGSKAVEKARSEKPDLVLLDIILPGMNGLDILKELKESDETKGIKIVMLTNFGTDSNVNRAVELGADDYLMKYNVVPSELPDKIASLLGETSESGVKMVS